jgi:hypothetical protein
MDRYDFTHTFGINIAIEHTMPAWKLHIQKRFGEA